MRSTDTASSTRCATMIASALRWTHATYRRATGLPDTGANYGTGVTRGPVGAWPDPGARGAARASRAAWADRARTPRWPGARATATAPRAGRAAATRAAAPRRSTQRSG